MKAEAKALDVAQMGNFYFFDKNSGNAYTNRWEVISGMGQRSGYAQIEGGILHNGWAQHGFYRDAARHGHNT